jgi:hypothetical protein
MSKGAGSGDKLARGAARATYSTTEGGVTDKKWDDIFEGYDPEAFKNAPNQSSQRVDASEESTGDVSVELTEAPKPTDS